MKTITIDCARIADKEGFHTALEEALEFPSWYGKNLDALHDCLAEICANTQVYFQNWHCLEDTLGHYTAVIQLAMTHAVEENPCIQVFFD